MWQLKFKSIPVFTLISYFLVSISLLNFDDASGQEIGSQSPNKYNSQQNQHIQNKFGEDSQPEPYPDAELVPEQKPPPTDVVMFKTNLTDTRIKAIFVSCDLVDEGKFVRLQNAAYQLLQVAKLNLQSDAVRNLWMSCRFSAVFLRNPMDRYSYEFAHILPRKQPPGTFDPYYNVSLAGSRKGNGSVTYVSLIDMGIFIYQQLLPPCEVTNESRNSLDSGFKLINSHKETKEFEVHHVILPMIENACYIPHHL